jgi:hypothetical protein
MNTRNRFRLFWWGLALLLESGVAVAQTVPEIGPIDITGAPGEAPRLGNRLSQEALLLLDRSAQIQEGKRIFSTPFNSLDGLGSGLPALQNNGYFRRMDGMDSQTCLECHSIGSTKKIPARFSVGGVGGVSQTAFPNVVAPNMDDNGQGYADIQGHGENPARMINPPFVFGAGGVELLAKEMTNRLQKRLAEAKLPENEGVRLPLRAKGISFGFVTVNHGVVDTSEIEGVGSDLVVRPFGRKGCCSTVRDFDIGALAFHHGMQPAEVADPSNPDPDGDGVGDEILVGELSALVIFEASLAKPTMTSLNDNAARGQELFKEFGCAICHVPTLDTNRTALPLAQPEEPTDPFDGMDGGADIFARIDLLKAGFQASGDGGVAVPLYADLKLHDMGPRLAEAVPIGPVLPEGVRRRAVAGGSVVEASAAADIFGSTVLSVDLDGQARRIAGDAPRAELDESSDVDQVAPERFFTTARLWGVADTAPYLHDGRAPTLTEAILFHGGEAASSQHRFADATAPERRQLLAFLRSLRTPTNPELKAAEEP